MGNDNQGSKKPGLFKRIFRPRGGKKLSAQLGESSWLERVAVALTAIWLAYSVLLYVRDASGGNALTLFGTAITVVGACLAILIYKSQGRQSEVLTDITHEMLHRVHKDVRGLAQSQAMKVKPQDDSDDMYFDPDEDASESMNAHNVDIGTHFVREQQDVPLHVVSNMVRAWESQEFVGEWTVRNIVGAFRKKGKGNTSWFVMFKNSDNEVVTWQLSKGGQGKTEPSAKEVSRIPIAPAAPISATA